MPSVTLDWHLPLPLLEGPPNLPARPGVYAFCFPVTGRYFAHYVGKAAYLPEEVRYHIDQYRKGGSWLLDLDQTIKEDSLGRPLYNPANRSCFDPAMRELAEEWVSTLVVFAAIVEDAPIPLRDVEGAVVWQFQRDPRQAFTRFCDMCHAVKQKGVEAIELLHSFQGPRIEGL